MQKHVSQKHVCMQCKGFKQLVLGKLDCARTHKVKFQLNPPLASHRVTELAHLQSIQSLSQVSGYSWNRH